MTLTGLSSKDIEELRRKYGTNKLTQLEGESLWQKLLNGFRDPMIMILLVALVVQLVLFAMGQAEWFEPVGIFVAIIIANGVAAYSENSQEHKANALKEEAEALERAKVVRDGYLQEIPVDDVVQGDIVYLQAGDKIPADGLMIEGRVQIDQSALNGETEEADKFPPAQDNDSYDINDLLNNYYVYRGTIVCAGEGYFATKVTGDRTLFGKMSLEVQEKQRETPLQVKLGNLAHQISTFGYVGAIAIIAGILAKTFFSGVWPGDILGWGRLIIDAVTVAVTIIVCAVPEGLPMLTSILLSLQSLKMAKDNVLVRKINGLETAGSISILFSDKTGTITEGKLSVVEVALGDGSHYTDVKSFSRKAIRYFTVGAGVNNGATHSNGNIVGGNSTDRALLKMLADNQLVDEIDKSKLETSVPFDSEKKVSSITYRMGPEDCRYFLKGAPEQVLGLCHYYIDKDGVERDFGDKTADAVLNGYINKQASRSMRLLAVAMGRSPDSDRLTLIGLISIRDNVRKEAVEAISSAQSAGVQVVMVTGDRKETAMAIAREAGLIRNDQDIVLTSDELKEKTDEEIKAILPDLRVVSRALPTDKSRLVKIAQALDYVVGMTGDGVNDAPALKKADVGFAMGSGTEVAKEAGDITILDDNFSSICKAILYGRTMFKSIRKFLIFQLTVNVAAVLTCFIGPLLGENVVLTVIQLLLINLAMDTLAAIAYGSEPALAEYMKDKPIPRQENIVTGGMMTEVIIGALYITIICLGILFIEPIRAWFGGTDGVYLKSAVFATFMMAISFNGFNARTEHLNPFEHLGRNTNFILVMLGIFVMQFVFVTFGGEALSVESLSLNSWLVCAGLAFGVIPVDVLRKAMKKAA